MRLTSVRHARRQVTASRSPGRHGHAWRLVRAHVVARDSHCAWCLEPLRPDLPHRDPVTGKVNAWATTVDHATPLALDGDPLDPSNLVAMHAYCNGSKGKRPLSRRPEPGTFSPPLRLWGAAPLDTDRAW